MKLSKKANVQQTVVLRNPYGVGIENLDESQWREFLFGDRSAMEMLEEVRDSLIMDIDVREMTMGQIVEGVRRSTALQYWPKVVEGDKYWSEPQIRRVAVELCKEAGVVPKPDTGSETIGEPLTQFQAIVPLYIGTALTMSMLAARYVLGLMGFESVWVKTERGRCFFFDSGPHPSNAPPLILTHGACTTGHCMLLLAMILKRKRRVIVPDLFDFDYSYSSTPDRDSEVEDHIQQISAVVRWLIFHGAKSVDLCGHSHGGHITAKAAMACKEFVRRVVLLCPAGLNRNKVFKSIHIWYGESEWLAPRMFPQFPPFIQKLAMGYAAGAFKSPNMCNLLLTISFRDYLLGQNIHLDCPVLLLWGDEDTILCPRDEKVMLRDMPQGRGYWIEGGSHMLIGDAVLAVCNRMEPFLCEGLPKTEPTPTTLFDRFLQRMLAWTAKLTRPMQAPPLGARAPQRLAAL